MIRARGQAGGHGHFGLLPGGGAQGGIGDNGGIDDGTSDGGGDDGGGGDDFGQAPVDCSSQTLPPNSYSGSGWATTFADDNLRKPDAYLNTTTALDWEYIGKVGFHDVWQADMGAPFSSVTASLERICSGDATYPDGAWILQINTYADVPGGDHFVFLRVGGDVAGGPKGTYIFQSAGYGTSADNYPAIPGSVQIID